MSVQLGPSIKSISIEIASTQILNLDNKLEFDGCKIKIVPNGMILRKNSFDI